MSNKLKFRVCRACLLSFDVANMLDLFEETGENLKKFQEISKINISQDKNKFHALICKVCMGTLELAFEIGTRIRRIEETFISNLRAEMEAENLNKQLEEDEAEKEKFGILMVIAESEDNMSIKAPTIKEELSDDDFMELVTNIEKEEETLQEVMEISMNYDEKFEENEVGNVNREGIKEAAIVSVDFHQISTEIEDQGIKDKDVSVKIVRTLEELNENCKSSTNAVGTEEDCDAQKMLPTKSYFVDLLTLYSEYTIEELSGLNLKEVKIFVEKVTSEADDCHEVGGENQPENQSQRNQQYNEGINRKLQNDSKLQCSICLKHFANKASLRDHMNCIHLKKMIFRCKQCPQIFNHKQNVDRHVRRIHTEKKPSKTFPIPALMTPNHCKICFRLCSNCGNLKHHIERVHKKKRNFTCDLCPNKYYQKGDLRRHIATHIFNNDDTTNSNRPHQCDFNGCGKYFKTERDLNHHKKKRLHN